jgi:hypothetical protein
MISESDLSHFMGTEEYYRHWTRRLVYTDGVKYVAERGSAFWLIDAIASHQPKAVRNPRLAEFQLWELE